MNIVKGRATGRKMSCFESNARHGVKNGRRHLEGGVYPFVVVLPDGPLESIDELAN